MISAAEIISAAKPSEHTISVAWPPAPLGEPGWRTRLEALAEQAESKIGRGCGLKLTAAMSMELVGVLWPVLGSPETIAATCRASLLVGLPGVICASSAGDQLTEIHTRLDAIWEAAQDDPAAGIVELVPPVLSQIKPVPYELVEPEPEPAEVIEVIEALVEPEPEPEPDELPAAWRSAEPEQHPVEALEQPAGPDLTDAVWLRCEQLAVELNASRSLVSQWKAKGLFNGMMRDPVKGEGRGEWFALEPCRAAFDARPGQRLRRASTAAPAPLPVVLTDLPPVVEPVVDAAAMPGAADAQALLELAGNDEGTLAALRALLASGPV